MSAKGAGRETLYPESIVGALVAPCGMDCALCIAYQRERNPCAGCNGDDEHKPGHCVTCGIKTCEELATSGGEFCYACESLPCARLKRLDKRYREKYGMSMLENLERIRDAGLDDFVAWERERWACTSCGGVVSVHRDECAFCGEAKQ